MRGRKKAYFNGKQFFTLFFTASVAMVIDVLMVLADTVIAGQMLGEEAIAAVSLVSPVYTGTVFFGTLICIGTSNAYSYQKGRFDNERANGFFGQGCILSAAIGLILCVLLFNGKNIYLQYLGVQGQTALYAREYYQAFPFVALLYPYYCVFTEMVFADGNDRLCNIGYSIQIVANVVASVFLCWRFGIAGIGFGTLIGILIGLLVFSLHFFSKTRTCHFLWHINKEDVCYVLKFGLTDGISYLSSTFAVLFLNRIVIAWYGTKMLPVLSAVLELISLTLVFDGIGQALAPVVNVLRGEENNPGIQKIVRLAEKVTVIEGIGATVGILLFAKLFARALGIKDPETLSYAVTALRIVGSTMIFVALKFLFTSYYMQIDHVALSIAMTLAGEIASYLVLGYLFGLAFGVNGLWVGLALSPGLALLLPVPFLMKKYGRSKVPLLLSDGQKIYNEDQYLTKDCYPDIMAHISDFMKQNQCSKKEILKTQLMVEEYMITVMENNQKEAVILSLTIKLLEKEIELILRNTGKIFEITDQDTQLNSLSQYVVSGFLQHSKVRGMDLPTTGNNRSSFRISRNQKALA